MKPRTLAVVLTAGALLALGGCGVAGSPSSSSSVGRETPTAVVGTLDPVERTAAPPDEGGRWYSYCRLLSIETQDGWVYANDESYDGTPWDCPERTDYLGTWLVSRPDADYVVFMRYQPERSVLEVLDAYSVPRNAGASNVSPNGYTIAVTAQGTFDLDGDSAGMWLDVTTTTPDEFDSYTRFYGVSMADGSSLEVNVRNAENVAVVDLPGLAEALASVRLEQG
jgi:hypothetical protein